VTISFFRRTSFHAIIELVRVQYVKVYPISRVPEDNNMLYLRA